MDLSKRFVSCGPCFTSNEAATIERQGPAGILPVASVTSLGAQRTDLSPPSQPTLTLLNPVPWEQSVKYPKWNAGMNKYTFVFLRPACMHDSPNTTLAAYDTQPYVIPISLQN